jgi:hypothetical protein
VQVRSDCGHSNLSDWSDTLIAQILNVGVAERLEDCVQVFPNPAQDHVDIRVSGNLTVTAMEVYDVYGKVVRTVVGANNDSPLQTRINVSGLSDGLYFLRVTTEKGAVVKAFVKR